MNDSIINTTPLTADLTSSGQPTADRFQLIADASGRTDLGSLRRELPRFGRAPAVET